MFRENEYIKGKKHMGMIWEDHTLVPREICMMKYSLEFINSHYQQKLNISHINTTLCSLISGAKLKYQQYLESAHRFLFFLGGGNITQRYLTTCLIVIFSSIVLFTLIIFLNKTREDKSWHNGYDQL